MTKHNTLQSKLASETLQEKELAQLRDLIYRIAGISMSPAKNLLVTGRLARRLKHYDLTSYGQYFRLITSAGKEDELQMAVDLLTTNETHFFREPKHFDFLEKHIIPVRKTRNALRIWSAACSSGEEAYSIAMLLDKALIGLPWEVVASDISRRVLEKARKGVYSMSRMNEIPPRYLSKYCLKGAGEHEGFLLIEQKLRDRVQFKRHNLTATPPQIGEFDVIFLRNVMIYFNQETKQKVVSRLLSLLRPGGYFFVGHSETLTGVTKELQMVQPAIYLKF